MNEIKHYGILGMKWGKRKSPGQVVQFTKNQLRLQKKSEKTIKALEDSRDSDSKIIKEHYTNKLNKLKKEHENIQTNKKIDEDMIKDWYDKKITKLKNSGKSTEKLESKMKKELEANEKFYNEIEADKIKESKKKAENMVKELAINKAFWDKEIESSTPSGIQKEELEIGLGIASTVLLIASSVAINAIFNK